MTKTKRVNKTIHPTKPFLRWAGSKKRLLPTLLKYVDGRFARYVEPFAGSSRLYFRLKPRKATIGDINRELIQTYREVKYRLPKLIRALRKLKKSKKTFDELRKQDPGSLTRTQRAARFIYLNRFCFNGLYRTNLKGVFNVPYGGKKSGEIPSKDLLMECKRALRRTRLSIGDFEKTMQHVMPGDFVYLDPPFHASGRRIFKEYDGNGFGAGDLKRLRQRMVKLDQLGAKFLVSYAKCKEADLLKEGFCAKTVCVRRSIAGFGQNRRRSYELLISNFETPSNLMKQLSGVKVTKKVGTL